MEKSDGGSMMEKVTRTNEVMLIHLTNGIDSLIELWKLKSKELKTSWVKFKWIYIHVRTGIRTEI